MKDTAARDPDRLERARSSASSPAGPSGRMLALATVGFLVNFWAWALISPLVRPTATS